MMRISWPARPVIIGTTLAVAALCAAASTPAYGAASPARAAVTSYTVAGDLLSVAAISATDAWAVGYSGVTTQKTLIVHWNGQKWSPVTSPKPVAGWLNGVTAVSADNVWAVGFTGKQYGATDILVMHWNGTSWSKLPGVPAVAGTFGAVAAIGNTLLAVGGLDKPPMLIMQRTGTTWKTYPVPSVGGYLDSLAVTGPDSGWAAGSTANSKGQFTGDILLRWNGSAWRSVSFPLQGTLEELWSLAAGPGGAVWAVGNDNNKAFTTSTPTSMLWNGTTWRNIAVSAPSDSGLYGVGFVPGGTVWAVGASNANAAGRTLTLRWTGSAWRQVASPTPIKGGDYLDAVAATSPHDAWAVGNGGTSKLYYTLILHWNGSTWS